MKKLLFATALVATAAAFADGPISAISFEGYTAGDTFLNGATEVGEDGNDKSVGPFFYYDGEQDGSSVKAFGGENAAVPAITRPLAFANASPNAKYLDLSTEGGILWRSINNIIQGGTQEAPTYSLGSAQTIAADGIFLDTLVQFTPTEESTPPTLEAEDKLAIWLSVNEGVTNLMVQAGYVDDGGALGETNFVLTGVSINPGQWYRLTVKAYSDILQPNEDLKLPAFSIYIDSTELSTGDYTISKEFSDESLSEIYLSGMARKVESGSVFVSRVAVATDEDSTLTAVGFKGSGALDDIVWTTEDPFAGGSGGEYPTYVGSDTTLQGQYDTWKALTGNAADTGSAYEKQFLLNTTQATTVADDALVIESITENATAGWDIVVSTPVAGAALSDGTNPTYNGYLSVIAADTLAGLSSATAVAYPVTAVAGGKVSINVTAGKFMKVQLSTTQAPAPAAGGQD